MFCLDKGSGEKTLLFLHGWGGSSASFAPLVNILCDTYRCLAPDFYGHGHTPAEHVCSVHDFALGVRNILNEKGVKEVIVVAHSFGGRVALDLVGDERIKGLVIIDGAGMKPRASVKKFFRALKYRLKKALRLDVSNCGSPDYKALSPLMKQTFVKVVNTHQDGVLRGIKQPVLLLWGKKDRDTPPYMAHRMHKRIKDCKAVFLSGGHFCYLDHVAEVCVFIRNFACGVFYGMVGGIGGRSGAHGVIA